MRAVRASVAQQVPRSMVSLVLREKEALNAPSSNGEVKARRPCSVRDVFQYVKVSFQHQNMGRSANFPGIDSPSSVDSPPPDVSPSPVHRFQGTQSPPPPTSRRELGPLMWLPREKNVI